MNGAVARCALGAGLLHLVACGVESQGAKPADSPAEVGGLVGNPAPDFSVKPLSGGKKIVSLKNLEGSVVLLDFWGTFCEPCKAEFPHLRALYDAQKTKGLLVVGVAMDTVQQLEAQLVMRNYEGFARKGRLRGRR